MLARPLAAARHPSAMNEGPSLARLAALIAEPSRAGMLTTLMAGQALTATELADAAGIGRATASAHLGRLVDAGLLAVASQGRHRYFRLAGEPVARMLEQLLGIAQAAGAVPLVTGPRDAALRRARVCYDHLAGELGVALHERLLARGALVHDGAVLRAGPALGEVLAPLGLAPLPEAASASRRPLCRACLDWSQRRDHLAGALGAALLAHAFASGWARREAGSRVVRFTRAGEAAWSAIGA
jgi:DNA-binding transcriptional ArsR family regulator